MTNNGHIPYWKPIRDDKTNYTYSIDNVVMRGKCHFGGMDDLLSYLSNGLTLTCNHFTTGRIGSYYHNFQFELPDDIGFFVGCGMNTANGMDDHIGIDFNPNKTMEYGDFVKILNRWLSVCTPTVRRFDLAVDLPVLRENVFMLKDRRKLSDPNDNTSMDVRKSWANHTSYLGRRSHTGYVKLYNKQLERQLNYPMTRLELTVDMDMQKLDQYMPEVRYFDDLQIVFDELKLTGTDRWILLTCIDDPQGLDMLSRYKRKTILSFLDNYAKIVDLNKSIVKKIYDQVLRYTKPFDLSRYEACPFNYNGSYSMFLHNLDEIEV